MSAENKMTMEEAAAKGLLSMDVAEEKREQLKQLFPEVFTVDYETTHKADVRLANGSFAFTDVEPGYYFFWIGVLNPGAPGFVGVYSVYYLGSTVFLKAEAGKITRISEIKLL